MDNTLQQWYAVATAAPHPKHLSTGLPQAAPEMQTSNEEAKIGGQA
jgi:hypothetical protein